MSVISGAYHLESKIFVSRRSFLKSASIMTIAFSTSACSTLLERDQALYCDKSQRELNLSLCNQMQLRQNFLAELTLAVLIGASIGAVIGTVATGNPRVGALIGAAFGGVTALSTNYIDEKVRIAEGNVRTALMHLKNDVRQDRLYLKATLQDIKEGIRKLELAQNNFNETFAKRTDNYTVGALIKDNAEKNTKAFLGAAKGYKTGLHSNKIPIDAEAEDLVEKIKEESRIANGAFLLLEDEYANIE